MPGVEVFVGGNSAIFTDFLTMTDTYQWIVLAFVLGLSFLLLMVVFRSLILPIKAILMNLLSVGAAYGAVTLVFQKGVGHRHLQRDRLQLPQERGDRGMAAAVPVLDPVRTVDGLPRVPALADP